MLKKFNETLEDFDIAESISSDDLQKIIEAGELYFEGVHKLRFNQKNVLQGQILNPEFHEFKDLDARSLGYMLNRQFFYEIEILNYLKEILENRKRKK